MWENLMYNKIAFTSKGNELYLTLQNSLYKKYHSVMRLYQAANFHAYSEMAMFCLECLCIDLPAIVSEFIDINVSVEIKVSVAGGFLEMVKW